MQQLPDLLYRMRHDGCLISLIAIDVDGMKGLNNKFGLEVGDTVMERLTFFSEQVTNRFLVARMGDDTLLIVLRDCGERQAMESAESLRLQIENHDWDSIASDLFVHCSVGVSEYGIEGAESFEPIQRVLYAMCEARRKGGNCVISETTLSTELLHRAKTRSMYRSIPIS